MIRPLVMMLMLLPSSSFAGKLDLPEPNPVGAAVCSTYFPGLGYTYLRFQKNHGPNDMFMAALHLGMTAAGVFVAVHRAKDNDIGGRNMGIAIAGFSRVTEIFFTSREATKRSRR